jgi:hypothetical protein
MSLVYPSFLWALLVLAVPIFIHLFNFRKTTRIYFSNTRFLKQVKEETTQKRKLKQYLVLASRLLFLFFLVTAFAQPFLPASDDLAGQQQIILYIDNSFSMSSPVADKTRALEEAVRMAQRMVDLFPPSTSFQLLTNDFSPFSNSFKTRGEVSDLLSQIKLSAISRSSSEILGRLRETQGTLFWFSDFQKSTFGDGAKIDSARHVRLVPLTLENHPNIFVDSIYLDNPFAIGGEKNSIHVHLQNASEKNVERLVIKLSINGVQAAATSVNISPHSFTEVPFDLVSGLKGNNRVVVSFNDFPISFDNQFFFTLNYTTRLNVIEIKASDAPTYIEKVFGNRDVFAYRGFNASNLNYSLLANADLLVVNGLDRIDDAMAAAIKASRQNFGSLLFVPGLQPDINSYQKLFSVPLSKATHPESPDSYRGVELDKPDFQNPFFANVFEDQRSSIAMPHAAGVIDWGVDRTAILKFKNARPFLSQFGQTFVLASPLEKTYTDFFNHALFVPVMYRIAASGRKSEQTLYYPITSPTIIIPSDSLSGDEPVKLIGDQELIPAQRQITGKLILELPKYAVSAGFYKVVHKRDTTGLLAFDLDKRESLLQQLTGEEAKAALGGRLNVSIFKANSAETFGTEIKERYLGKPLWKYAIVLSLIFLLAEVLLIRFLR